MKVRGTVVREDLGAGAWVLVADDGARYALKGGDDDLRRDGQHVRVEGSLEEDAFGVDMTGDPVLAVERYTTA